MAISRTDRGLVVSGISGGNVVQPDSLWTSNLCPEEQRDPILCVSFSQSPEGYVKTDSGAAHGIAPESALVN